MPLLARKLAGGLAASAICIFALAGCTSSPSDDSGSKDSGSKGSGDKGSSQAGVENVDLDKTIVEQDVKVPGSSEDTATIGILSLKVEGKTQRLQMAVTPHFKSVDDDESVNIYDVWGTQSFSPQLVDADNLKVYSPIRDGAEKWTSDAVYTTTKNEEPMLAWAVYAAPEDDLDSFDIRLYDTWPDFTDVPITK